MSSYAQTLAKDIKLLVLDVDGVLTDGGLYYDANGMALKRFNVQDGFGIKLAQSVGLEIGVITGLNQKPVEARITELGISHYYPGNHNKIPHFKDMCQRVGIQPSQAAFMGDDWIDLGAMECAGLALAVPNAVPEVLTAADWIASRSGGHGAVREAIAFILKAQGLLEEAMNKWAG
jgi:3-deoxy-D-manno-octulosonate 8-phosphate phosphatase (KDO 8-P phosphatase)